MRLVTFRFRLSIDPDAVTGGAHARLDPSEAFQRAFPWLNRKSERASCRSRITRRGKNISMDGTRTQLRHKPVPSRKICHSLS